MPSRRGAERPLCGARARLEASMASASASCPDPKDLTVRCFGGGTIAARCFISSMGAKATAVVPSQVSAPQ
jgi:hypothetical protein